jgi:hypothetical protein
MDRARRPTVDFFSQNLHATHTNLAKSSGGPYVAAELRGDGPAEEHLATGTEAVKRRMATHLSDVICSPGPGEQYLSAKRLAIREGEVFELYPCRLQPALSWRS